MVQGIAFLSKKSWHTKNLANQERVWIAEQREAAEKSKTKELARQITLEREREELDRLAGKKSHHDRGIDWMYQHQKASGEASELEKQDEANRQEQFLLGKEFTGDAGAAKGDFAQASGVAEGVNAVVKLDDSGGVGNGIAEGSVAERNEAFRQRVEDPMFQVSQKEREKRIEANKQKALYERVMGPIDDVDSYSDGERKRKSSSRKDRKREHKESKRERKEERKRKRDDRHYERKRHRSSRREDDSDDDSIDERRHRHSSSGRKKYYSSEEEDDDRRRRHGHHGSSRRRSRSRSNDRKSSRSRSSRRHRSRSRSRSRSPASSRHSSRHHRDDRHRHRDDRRYSRDERKRYDDNEEGSRHHHSRHHESPPRKLPPTQKPPPSEGRVKTAGYGLQGKAGASSSTNPNDLGPNADLLKKKRQSVEEERRRAKERAGSRRTMTAHEREQALKEMRETAHVRSTMDTRRPNRDNEDEGGPSGKANFIQDMTERAHGIKGNGMSMASRMRENRNMHQRSHDDSFL